jgi:hypothetical protein
MKQLTVNVHPQNMRLFSGFCPTPLFVAALVISAGISSAPLQAQGDNHENQRSEQKNSRSYHDAKHNDDHQWNDREDQAYQKWTQENHRKNNDFSKLKPSDQQSYWDWRHNHSDAQLNIEIR